MAWTPFESPLELKALVTRVLARILLDRGEQLGLHLDEAEAPLALAGAEEETPAEPDGRRGAGRDGVTLGCGRKLE